MKKLLSFNAFKMAIALSAVIPLGLNAQSDNSGKKSFKQTVNEFYGKPSNWRPYDQGGINVFETSKVDSIAFEGPRIRFGAGFTQQYQSLKHENKGAVDYATANKLYPLTAGFMTAQANLFTDIQLGEGIRLNVTTYLSSRHHNEAWVKGGYIQFDKLPFKGKFWDNLMNIATIKVGHMEINYGDAHFRRSDGGQTLYNPFMENNIMDAFATEIGGEVYLQKNGFFGMLGMTNGMIKGNVDSTYVTKNSSGEIIDNNTKKAPSIYLKGGIDKSVGEALRIRVSGSYYHNSSAAGSGLTLYGGDRTGSNYQNVMEKVPYGTPNPSGSAIPFSGRLNPGFSKKVNAFMFNGFLKVNGLELFGTYETASGRTKNETVNRRVNQLAGDVVYRFGKNDNLFLGGRYNTVKAELNGFANKVTVNRLAGAAGWFVTRNVLLKGELVQQKYKDFPTTDYRAAGKFSGVVIEAVVGF